MGHGDGGFPRREVGARGGLRFGQPSLQSDHDRYVLLDAGIGAPCAVARRSVDSARTRSLDSA
jgi:hypothetical protein